MTKYHKNGNICPTYHGIGQAKCNLNYTINFGWVKYVVTVVLAIALRFLCCA